MLCCRMKAVLYRYFLLRNRLATSHATFRILASSDKGQGLLHMAFAPVIVGKRLFAGVLTYSVPSQKPHPLGSKSRANIEGWWAAHINEGTIGQSKEEFASCKGNERWGQNCWNMCRMIIMIVINQFHCPHLRCRPYITSVRVILSSDTS